MFRAGWFLSAMYLCLSSVSAFAGAGPELYGHLSLAYENVDRETEAHDYWQLKSYYSRFGVRGEAGTEIDGLNVLYRLEWGVDIPDERRTSENHLVGRSQYLGVTGGYGELILGRNDTPFKLAQCGVDLFNDFDADIMALMAHGEMRVDNIVQYATPEIGERMRFTVMAIPGEQSNSQNNAAADAFSASAVYDDGRLYTAAALDSEVAGPDVDAGRLAARWSGGWGGVGALWQLTDYGAEEERVQVVSAYLTAGALQYKLQWGHAEHYAGLPNGDADLAAAGVDYHLSGNTRVGVHLIRREGGDGLAEAEEKDTFGFSIVHVF